MQEITLRGSAGSWVLGVSDTQGLIGVSGNNYLRTGTDTWTISIASSGEATMTSAASSRVIKHNSSSNLYATYSSGQVAVQLYKKDAGDDPTSDWETTAIAISKTTALAETIYNTTEDLPELDDIAVTKTEHDNNDVAADRDTDVTSSSTLHWIYADGENAGEEVELPISTNGTYNVKIWASVTGETLTSKDNATAAKQYVTGTLVVEDEPTYVTVAYTNTSTTTNMTGGNDASTLGVSATEWSIKGYKNNASSLPGLNKAKQIRLYGNASGGNYICVNTLKANRYIVKIDLSTSNSSNFAVYEGDETTSGTAISGTDGTYTFGDDVTGFTIINTNSGTTQVYILSIDVYYVDATVTTPTIILSNTPSSVGIGNTVQFTVEYFNLTSNFEVTTNATYVTASYTGATGTGEATVTLTGVSATNSTTVTVSSTGATSQSFDVEVAVLPIIDATLNSLTWSGTSYAGSPHTVTWNSSYEFVVSAGQLNTSVGYLGTNSGNKAVAQVSSDSWTLKGTTIADAMAADDNWSSYGQALYMSNFGVLHPNKFVVSAANSNYSDTNIATYYILASVDSGSSWTILTSGTVAAGTDMSWTGSTYSANSNNIQFAFVTTASSYGTISNITVQVYGDSYATTKILDSIYVSGTPTTEYFAGETFDLGSAKVYAKYTDSVTYPDEDVTSQVTFSAIEHGTTSVTITYLSKTTSVNVTVEDYGDEYKKATSLGELLDGSKVVLGSNAGTALMGVQNTNNRKSEPSAYSDGYVSTYSINTAVFTVGIIEENGQKYYTFKDSDNKYLYAGSTSGNYLYSGTSLTDAGKWSLTISDAGAVEATVSVTVSGEATTKYMGGNASAFGCYTSLGTTSLSIFVDVVNNVTIFESQYMHTDIAYNPDPSLPINNSGNCNSEEWYVTAKAVLVNMGQDYIDEFTTNSKFADACERYNAWATACHDSTPFAGEGVIKSSAANILFGNIVIDSTNVTAIIVIVSLTTLTALGGYFFLRKKKEQ